MSADTTLYVGLMSGTSADAIDAVLVDFASTTPNIIATLSSPLSPEIRAKIHALATPSNNEIDRMGELDQQLGYLFAQTVRSLLTTAGIAPSQVSAIGSHGQTIRHRPPPKAQHPFTLQIGDPNLIAQLTKITTVADFRRRDMAAGGQGAPLVPAFHRAVFQSPLHDRAIVNIGGMANITWLPKQGEIVGFDTGPGNALMDIWALKNLGKPYDANGDWAASGSTNLRLLEQLLAHPFFHQPHPKSTGREAFNGDWLEGELSKMADPIKPEDIQATLLSLTACSIANSIKPLSELPCELYICGGGAHNKALLRELGVQLPNSTVQTTASLGVAPEWVEAMAFAWLAKQTMNKLSGNSCAVTGAREEVILGGVYFA